jgi:hypothetical protein
MFGVGRGGQSVLKTALFLAARSLSSDALSLLW